jgi:hypothetical protein
MTRRGRYAWAIATIAAWTLVSARACAGAAAGPSEPPDLSALEFAPSLPAGTLPDPARARSEPEPQPRSSAAIGERMLRLAESIATEQASEGVFSPGLIYSLVSLAKLYQEVGDHVAAIATLEKARQIVRVTSGLSSLNQAEMTLLEITSLEAMGELAAAARERNFLVDLAREHPTDLRVGAIYAVVADARVAAVERWLADKSEPPTIFGSDPLDRDSVRSGLTAAQMNYVDALRATATVGSPGGPDIYELESALTRTFYIQAQNRGLFFGPDVTPYKARKMLDGAGSSSYERRVKYSRLLQRPPTQIASHLIELGDWHLFFHEDEAGAAAYREARDVLIGADASAEEIDALFTPIAPMLLPAFAPHFIDGSEALGYDGYIDALIDLDRYGRSTRVRITAQSGAAQSKVGTAAIAARLKKYVAKSQFRPRFVNGERTEQQLVAMRYYFKY